MRHHQIDENLNLHPSSIGENSGGKFVHTQLLMLLVLFITGICVDVWFNRHQLPWQLSNFHPQMSTSTSVHS
ncbi:hypothetical protein ACE1AT_02205 [Pelatocladus sp. BLCC-F211]|uniref:hypothetical protein n=1 Tax=Pelatocladus sp. BLCC-F211 TaxID=3342752 RepID=UPI0035B8787E